MLTELHERLLYPYNELMSEDSVDSLKAKENQMKEAYSVKLLSSIADMQDSLTTELSNNTNEEGKSDRAVAQLTTTALLSFADSNPKFVFGVPRRLRDEDK